MSSKPEERARVEAWLATLAAEGSTLAVGQTLRAPSAEWSATPTEPGPLPRITLEPGGDAEPLRATTGDGDLRIVSTLGEGGQGRVHLAWQASLGREVAVKTLKEHASVHSARALFAEARRTGSLEHPGVIPVHALGADERGRPVLVMKRVEGVDWQTLLDDPEHPAWERRRGPGRDALDVHLEILVRLSEPLELAHGRGVVHRDIKPENVMLGDYGEVYLVDWGIATEAGAEHERAPDAPPSIVGTPAFMAPEMALDQPVDARTDVYLLGATLHYVLTGTHRHRGDTLAAVLYSALTSEPVEHGREVPEALAELANRATALDPSERPPSARAFRDELLAYQRRRGVEALCGAAEERLADLRAMLESAGDAAPADPKGAYRLGGEARFGLTQCLREDPSFERAAKGLAACIAALVGLELRLGHTDSAAALLEELPGGDEALGERIAAARQAAARARAERDALQAMARDLDPSRGARARTWALGSLGLLTAALGGAATITIRTSDLKALDVFVIGLALLAGMVVLAFVVRRHLLATAFNRRATGLFFGSVVASSVSRGIGVWADVEAIELIQRDALIFALVFGASAITLLPRLAIACGVATLILTGMSLWPEHAVGIFSGGTTLNVFVSAWILGRAAGEPNRSPPA